MFTNLIFTDNIDGLEGSDIELISLISKFDQTVKKHVMEINETKTNTTTNSDGHFISEIINDNTLRIHKFKYLGSIVDEVS